MNTIKKCLCGISLLSVATSASAFPFTFEGRSLGMGGVSVATADIATAAFANPAMLTNQLPSDDFALLIGIGAFIRDNDNLLTDIDDYQAANDRLSAAENAGDTAAEARAVVDMASVINRIQGKVIAPELSGAVAMGIAFNDFALALSVRADAIAGGTVTNLSCSPLEDPTCDTARLKSELTSTNFNILNLEGVLAEEFGVSIASDFNVMGKKLSVGVKPKLVNLQGVTFRESILTVSAGIDSINQNDNTYDLGNFTTVDLGLAYELTDSFRLGFTARNLLTEDFKVGTQVLNFDTEYRIGVAYHNRFLTVGVDYDLKENDPLLANKVFEDKLRTQYLAAGAELNAFDFMQLRIGASKNMASGIPGAAQNATYTAGVGIWLGFNLDIAAIYNDNSLGGYLQTGFRF